ncbi:LAME_0F15610g1_1 [Lachancea meyersii CBS 8951]|uniref:Altered inheritance of mitochondria protein 6 n=1 Tax=Lachancea meyersii CBS 8951 TaxID=1266667 RepID=A0A1G4JYJ6_9SACH|nr:LAME_0F15610g1_1 [Lachancea meyersii CBS 8951]
MIRTFFAGLALAVAAFWAGTLVQVRGTPILATLRKDSRTSDPQFSRNLGITGPELLDFFKHQVLTSASSEKPGKVKVSKLYDTFVKSLSLDAAQKNDEGICFPENSMVSKLNRNVNPVSCLHSHNDYWRDLPMFEALCHGIASIEADVWLIDGSSELAVGHNIAFLDPVHRTLDSLYTGPLLSMLNEVNCHQDEKDHKYGVFYNSPETSLYFYIDFKSEDSTETYHRLIYNHLKPLIDMGYVTFFDLESEEVMWNPLTVVLTGDYPQDLSVLDGHNEDGIFHTNRRFVFLDAPLQNLEAHHAQFSVVASASLSQLLSNCSSRATGQRRALSSGELECIRLFVDAAHSMNLKTRIWGVPGWPNDLKRELWKQQVNDLQVDFLNIDDLYEASRLF